MSTMNVPRTIVLAAGLAALAASAPVRAQQPGVPGAHSDFVTVGLFIAGIEEGARIFTPVRLLPFAHAEAMGHEIPTVEQFHGGEDRLLVSLGRHAGLLLGMTLQRYPTEPDSAWPYAPFRRAPARWCSSFADAREGAVLPRLPHASV